LQFKPKECTRKAKPGDTVSVHYTVRSRHASCSTSTHTFTTPANQQQQQEQQQQQVQQVQRRLQQMVQTLVRGRGLCC
jgi:hypothetical protein